MILNAEQFQIFLEMLGELKNIKLEMKTLKSEVEALKSEIGALRQDMQVLPLSDSAYQHNKRFLTTLEPQRQDQLAAEPQQQDQLAAEQSRILTVIDWLLTRNITVKTYHQHNDADVVFNRLANHLGDKYETLKFFYESIKKRLSAGPLKLSLAKRTQVEINDITAFCLELQRHTFLQAYQYSNGTKTIHAVIQNNGDVINFFTGSWFERFIYAKACALLEKEHLSYTSLMNVQVSLPNGDDFEIDIIFLIDEQPVWIECKTGNIEERINKYKKIREILRLPSQRALIVSLDMTDDIASGLSSMYGITVTNQITFLSHFHQSIRSAEERIASYSSVNSATNHTEFDGSFGHLSVLLNKAGLRPFPEYRNQVIQDIIQIIAERDISSFPMTLRVIKEILASHHTDLSKSKLQDILNAIVRSGCLINDQGKPVLSMVEPFAQLVSDHVEGIDYRCQYSYIQAILSEDPSYFDDSDNLQEYARIVGTKPPTKMIQQMKALFAQGELSDRQ
ncbi:MAG: DUF1887 family protein [Chloroflexaceae bacterium]|nr:DUF1887 family protein [Chloroflexaceae bacterium]